MNKNRLLYTLLLLHPHAWSMENPTEQLNKICTSQNIRIDQVQSLLDKGADVNTYNEAYGSLLHRASHQGLKKITQICLQYGANVNVKNTFGNTPLVIACVKNNQEIALLLLRHGANIHTKRSALFAACAAGHRETALLLVDHNADIHILNKKPQTANSVANFKQLKPVIIQRAIERIAAIHYYFYKQEIEVCDKHTIHGIGNPVTDCIAYYAGLVRYHPKSTEASHNFE